MSNPAQPEPTSATDADADEQEQPAEEEAPLNRAARRAKAKKVDPSHVGPQGSPQVRQGRGPRSHTKRQIG